MAKFEEIREVKRLKIKNRKALFLEIQTETDRGLSIVAATYFDNYLGLMLEKLMVNDPKEVESLLGINDSANKPLGTFSSRIRAAYCLGLISMFEKKTLELIRGIRNQFAHQMHGISFNSDEIVKLLNKLRNLEEFKDLRSKESRHRVLFQVIVVILIDRFSDRLNRRKKLKIFQG